MPEIEKKDEPEMKDNDKSEVNDPEDKDEPKAKGDKGERTFTQKEVDDLIDRRFAKEKIKSNEREKAAAAKAKKDAEERQLVDDKNFEEIASRSKIEADEATAKLEEYERKDLVNALLDKKKITRPDERTLFLALNVDGLEDLGKHIDSYEEMINSRVEADVLKQLGGDPPPKGPDAKPKEGDLASQLKTAEAKAAASGDAKDWDIYLALANRQSDAITASSKRSVTG